MNRASHQAGEGSAFPEGLGEDSGVRQPVDPFETLPRGGSNEEVGFGSLAFEDSVIVERSGGERSGRRMQRGAGPGAAVSRLRLSRAFAAN